MKVSDEMTNFTGEKESGVKNHLINSYYLDDFSKLDELSNGERDWFRDLVFGMGNWGTKYTYYIDIYNEGNDLRTIQFNVNTGNFLAAIYTVREFSPTESVTEDNYSLGAYITSNSKAIYNSKWGASRNIFDNPIEIPTRSRRVIRVSYLSGVGTSAFQSSLMLE